MVINPLLGVYIPIMGIPTKGGMSIPKYSELIDPDTYDSGILLTEILGFLNFKSIPSRELTYPTLGKLQKVPL